jgi:YD repeat-containing protein
MNKMWITRQIRFTAFVVAICSTAITAKAQYYYKDIIVTGQINANYRALRDNKVTHVTLTPSALDPSQNTVTLQQTVYPTQKLVITYTKVPDATESWLKSYYNANGLLIKTVDSSADVVTSSLYEYDAASRIVTISNNSVPVNDPAETETHLWNYNSNGQPVQMVKIKNGNDTTLVSFTADEQGNVAEENAVHKKNNSGTTYYYYDAQHHLTDVARFNARANRILPDYMFEYNDAVQLTQMIVVPEGSADYQTWKYMYNQQGLKEKDVCYSKQKEMVASIEYVYTFGR